MFNRWLPKRLCSASGTRLTALGVLAALGLLSVLRVATPALALQKIPADQLLESLTATADVNDFAGILQPDQREALESRCKELREKTGAQLAVVTLKSLGGGQIDDFAVKLFERWGIGKKGQDNGILLLVAIDDRKARIEVGYGLEPILPDALAGRVLDQQLFPAFKQQRYNDGLLAAVNRLIEIVERNEPAPKGGLGDIPGQSPPLLFITVLLAIAAFFAGVTLRKGGGCGGAAMFAALLMCVGCVFAFPWAPAFHVPLSIFLAWLGWLSVDNRVDRRRRPRTIGSSPFDNWGTTWTGGGFSGGGFSGGSFSGGGGSWGGFSGGSSGGGGASGSW